jgi:hypothetical protein
LSKGDNLTELHPIQNAFKVEIYDGKLRERKMESYR